MLWGFSTNGFYHEGFFMRAVAVAQTKDLQTQHLANILWAFGRVCPNIALRQRAMLSLLPSCNQQVQSFKAEELGSAALSLAKTFGGNSADGKLPGVAIEFLAHVVRLAPACVSSFSLQSLINVVNAFAMISMRDEDHIYVAFGQEALQRMQAMSSQELLRTFQAFLAAATRRSNTSAAACSGLMAAGLAWRVDSLKKHEAQCLSRLCCEFFGIEHDQNLSRKELHDYCLCLAASPFLSRGAIENKELPATDWRGRVTYDTLSTLSTQSTDDIESSAEGDQESGRSELEAITHRATCPASVTARMVVKNTFVHIEGLDGDVIAIAALQRSRSVPSLFMQG